MSVSIRLQRCTSAVFVVLLASGLTSCGSIFSVIGPARVVGPEGEKVVAIIEQKMKEQDLTSAVYGVWRGDEVIVGAAGGSPIGLPATPDMQVRIGQPMEPMLSTVLLQLDGEGILKQDEPIAKWLPDFPRADQITPKMLADSTSGISDYVTNPNFLKQFYANPIKGFTTEELLTLANERPPVFAPGKSFAYAHSDLVVLGEVMEKATGKTARRTVADAHPRPAEHARQQGHADASDQRAFLARLHQRARRLRGFLLLEPDGIPP